MPVAWLNNRELDAWFRRKELRLVGGNNLDLGQTNYAFCKTPAASLAIFTAIRRASSRVNSFAADLRPGSSGVSPLVAALLQQGWRCSGPSVFVTPAEKYVIEHGVPGVMDADEEQQQCRGANPEQTLARM
jgi:hypothetical protein